MSMLTRLFQPLDLFFKLKAIRLPIINQQRNKKRDYMEPEYPYQRPTTTINIGLSLTEETSQVTRRFQFNVPFFEEARAIKINSMINQILERRLIREAQFFLYDHINKFKVFLGIFPPIATDVMIETHHIIGNVLHLSFREVSQRKEGMMEEENHIDCFIDNRSENDAQSLKKRKQTKQRTIDEAVEAVRQWRTLYDTADDSGKRLFTLDEAARKVGVPKKTLDDYFMKIRIAAKYDFHFEKMKHQKFGKLRQFVKMAKQEGIQKLRQEFGYCILDSDTDKYWINFANL